MRHRHFSRAFTRGWSHKTIHRGRHCTTVDKDWGVRSWRYDRDDWDDDFDCWW
jgi:hypothetical protein